MTQRDRNQYPVTAVESGAPHIRTAAEPVLRREG